MDRLNSLMASLDLVLCEKLQNSAEVPEVYESSLVPYRADQRAILGPHFIKEGIFTSLENPMEILMNMIVM